MDEMKALESVTNLMRFHTFFRCLRQGRLKGFTEKYTIKLPSSSEHVALVRRRTSSGKLLTDGFRSITSTTSQSLTSSTILLGDGLYEYLNARDNYIQTLYHESAHT